MGRFFSMLIATFVSVLCALATWSYAERYLTELEANEVAAVVDVKKDDSKKVTKKFVDHIRYEWKVEDRTNPVTGEKVTTATRFSEDIGSAVTFRCYGMEEKSFDVLVSFPDSIDWNSTKYGYYFEMKFRIDKGELSAIRVDRSSSSVAIPELKEGKYNSKEENKGIREFWRIGSASTFGKIPSMTPSIA